MTEGFCSKRKKPMDLKYTAKGSITGDNGKSYAQGILFGMLIMFIMGMIIGYSIAISI